MLEKTTTNVLVGVAAVLVLGSCTAPGGPGSVNDPNFFGSMPPGPSPSEPGAPPSEPVAARCVPVEAESLPARSSVMSEGAAMAVAPTMFTKDLFGLFRSHCGGCHVETNLGDFKVTEQTFAAGITPDVVGVMKSDDPVRFMPPPAAGGVPWSTRPPNDPVVELVTLIELWMEQGKPDYVFTLPHEEMAGGPRYALSPTVGKGMTNIGNCVPNGTLVASNQAAMDALDATFAAATEIPATLAETDLTTWDGEVLARDGMVAFAPAYPLFSDNAAKIRHIRVPRGQSVVFDKATQSFSIPPNTRFYKTFLKKVIDGNGNESYRKIETRLIVSRPDREGENGQTEVTALFGAYVWNQEETEATLLRDTFRNGKPFRDRMITYTTNELKRAEIEASMPANLEFEIEKGHPELTRKYAIPSSERCVECHSGTPMANFVLGFTPLQIARRPLGEGGVIERPRADELTQLARFIEYGIVTGLSTPADVLPLEASQGARKPRNHYELVAQGYMLGSCAGCHNPRGFPSRKSPPLMDALDMWPSATGGVFEFPLDRVSPLRRRGVNQDVPMPYITPSLREYPVAEDPGAADDQWTPKWFNCENQPTWRDCNLGGSRIRHVSAPWRSLLYRNVETPFMYVDDWVIFPRMPMHVPGFDCRLPRIMGDWMVSVPAKRKHPEINEDFVPGYGNTFDKEPQPYLEVRPGEPGYAEAVAEAEVRLEHYRKGGRYNFCPDDLDIVDRQVLEKDGLWVPQAESIFDRETDELTMPNLRVPVRAHWVVTDLTDRAGDWGPRRPDWKQPLVDGVAKLPEKPTPQDVKHHEQQQEVVAKLKGLHLSDRLRKFALSEVPYGVWTEKPGCDFTGVPKAGDMAFQGDGRPRWMVHGSPRPAPRAPVYMQAPGAAVYAGICFNCHGPRADSKGLLAEAVSLMTGGNAAVANFRDGLFGPPSQPGANRMAVFGGAARPTDELAASYVAWMALGGTERQLPSDLLNIVGSTRIFGALRNPGKVRPQGSPNMLRLAQDLCSHVLPASVNARSFPLVLSAYPTPWSGHTGLLDNSFDAEMWLELCSIDNEPVVRVPEVKEWKEGLPLTLTVQADTSLYWGKSYPADAKVMNHKGKLETGLRPENLFPVCVRAPADPAERAVAETVLAANPVNGGDPIPFCPAGFLVPDNRLKVEADPETGHLTNFVDGRPWAIRGAANAGLAVYLYLDQMIKENRSLPPPHDKCEERQVGP